MSIGGYVIFYVHLFHWHSKLQRWWEVELKRLPRHLAGAAHSSVTGAAAVRLRSWWSCQQTMLSSLVTNLPHWIFYARQTNCVRTQCSNAYALDHTNLCRLYALQAPRTYVACDWAIKFRVWRFQDFLAKNKLVFCWLLLIEVPNKMHLFSGGI